jgi:hypothetical protein
MTTPDPPPNRNRRRLIAIAVIAAGFGWLWMRFDQRFVGTWTTEFSDHKMIISTDGKVDGFFVAYGLGGGAAIIGGGPTPRRRSDPQTLFKIHGRRFELVAIPLAASSFTSVQAWLDYNIQTSFNTTERVIYSGEIVSVDPDSFMLSIDGIGPVRYVRTW